MAKLNGNRSLFAKNNNYEIDSIDEVNEIPLDKQQSLEEYRLLKAKTSLNSTERDRLNQLQEELSEYMMTAEKWNFMGDILINIQKFFKESVVARFNEIVQKTERETSEKIDNLEQRMRNIVYKGEYNDVTQYNVGNFVVYNENVYICINNCFGVQPVNISHWQKLTIKGETGRGIGLNYKGLYQIGVSYLKDDLVQFNNSLYCAKQNNNTNPNNTSYWELFLSNENVDWNEFKGKIALNQLSMLHALNYFYDEIESTNNQVSLNRTQLSNTAHKNHSHRLTDVSGLENDLRDLSDRIDNIQINANDILTKLKTVDGDNSGLDADLLDGKHASDFVLSVPGKGLSTYDYNYEAFTHISYLKTALRTTSAYSHIPKAGATFNLLDLFRAVNTLFQLKGNKGFSTYDYTLTDRNKVINLPANTNQEIANLKNSVVNGKNAIATAINDLALENVANSSMTHNDLGVVIRNNLNVPYVFFKNGKFNKKNINPITRVVSYRNGLSDYYNESQKGSYIDINNYTIRLNGVSGAYGGILISPQMIDFSGYHFIGISTSQGYGRLRVGLLNALPPVIKGSLINKPSATQSFYIDIIDGSVKLSTGRFLNSPRGYFFIECENWQGVHLTISEIYFFRA